MNNYEPNLIINEQELTIIKAVLQDVDYEILAQQVYDGVHQFDYELTDTMIGFVEDVTKRLQLRIRNALNAAESTVQAHYYFEVASVDRYTGFITMVDGRCMQFMHVSYETEDAYLQDVATGEAYPIVKILGDGDTELYITEV